MKFSGLTNTRSFTLEHSLTQVVIRFDFVQLWVSDLSCFTCCVCFIDAMFAFMKGSLDMQRV